MKVTSDGDPIVLIHHIVEMMQTELETMAKDNGTSPEEMDKLIESGVATGNSGMAALTGAYGMIRNVHNAMHDVMASPNLADLTDKGAKKKAAAYRPNFWDELDDEHKIKYMKALGRQ